MEESFVKEKLEVHDDRLNDHADRIRELEIRESATNEKIASLCEKIEKQTHSINALVGLLASSLIGFFFYAIQSGLFK